MAKLYFRYGAMGAAKSANLLMVAHNYRKQGKRPLLVKALASADSDVINSRCGLKMGADVLALPDTDLWLSLVGLWNHCVLVDEAQFLTSKQVEALRRYVTEIGTPVICYGLRADFRSRLFRGSKRLMELADSIEEIKTICAYCECKATQNLRLVQGEDQVMVGGDEMYAAACFGCFKDRQKEWWYAPSEL